MDIDVCLQQAGEFGPAQKRIYYLVNLMNVLAAMQTLAPAFIAFEPEWTCSSQSQPEEQQTALQRCTAFEEGRCRPHYLSEYTTVVTEWDLVCLWSYLPKLSQSAYFVGMMFGCWSLGSFAERIGRKKVYFLSIGLYSVFTLGCGLAPNFLFFTLFRAGMGVGDGGLVVTMYVLSMELLESTHGCRCSAMLCQLVHLEDDTRIPRWLVLKGRVVEAKQLLTWIAKRNGKHLADSTFELKGPGKDLQSRPVSILDLFRGQTICRRTIILSSHWCTVSLVYYALSLSADSFLCPYIVVLNRWGRRFTNSGSLVAAGVLCLVCAGFVGRGGAELYLVGFSLAGKFAASASFAIAYLYAVELFPTQVRNLGVGVCSLSARIGGIAAPLILLTDKWGAPVPMLVMGTMALVAGSLSSLLPETLNTPLPETLEELDIHSRMTVT
eukprot:Em0019g653a